MVPIIIVIIAALVTHNVVFFGGASVFSGLAGGKSKDRTGAGENHGNTGANKNSESASNCAVSGAKCKDSALESGAENDEKHSRECCGGNGFVSDCSTFSRNKRAVIFGTFVAAVVFVSGIINWAASLLLVRLGAEAIFPFVTVIVAALVTAALGLLLKKLKPEWRMECFRIELVVVVAAALITAFGMDSLGAVRMIIYALFSGLGYLLAVLIMAGIAERMDTANVPRFFKGVPIFVLAAAIIAFAFMGFDSFSLLAG